MLGARTQLRRLVCIAIALAISACDREKPPPTAVSSHPSAPGATKMASAPDASATPDRRGNAPIPIPVPAGLTERPKLALYVNDPWALVLGSELPSTVVYEDGRVLRLEPEPPRMIEATLTGNVSELLRGLESSLLDLPAKVSITHTTDQPTVSVLLETPRGWILRSVYGLRSDGTPSIPAHTHAKPSAEFSSALSRIVSLPLSARKPYEPARVEIMLWGFEHSKLRPAPWPAAIPPPKNPVVPKQGVLHHYVDGKLLPEIDRFRASLEPNQAVLLAGSKWSIGRRLLVPADAHLIHVRIATWRAYVEAVIGKQR